MYFVTPQDFLYILEKYGTFEITLKMNHNPLNELTVIQRFYTGNY